MQIIPLSSVLLLQSLVYAVILPNFTVFNGNLIKSVCETSETIFSTRSKTISVTLAVTQLDSVAESYDFLTTLIMKLSPKSKLMLNFEKFSKVEYPTLSNIFIVDSYAAFRGLYRQIRHQVFDFTALFMVIVPFDLDIGVQKVFDDLWEVKIVNVVVLTRKSSENFSSFTYYPYQPDNCRDTKPVPTLSYFPEKYENLNRCPVYVSTFNCAPFVILDHHNQVSGIEGTVVRELANDMNFSIVVEIPRDGVRWGEVKPNGEATGAIKDIIDKATNFSVGLFSLEIVKPKHFDNGVSHYITYFVAMVPPGRPYTGLETLLLPFQNTLWTAILCSFLLELTIAFITTRIRYPGQSKNFIFQLYSAWIGNAMTSVPKSLLGRSLMIMWVFHCLVLRTVYQGKLYDNMRHMRNKSHIKTYAAAFEDDFRFYLPKESIAFIESMPEVLARAVYENVYLVKREDSMRDSTTKISLLTTSVNVAYLNQQHKHRGILKVIPEHQILIPLNIFYPKQSPFRRPFDDKLLQYQASGLIDFWASKFVDLKYAQDLPQEEEPPRSLRMHDLAASFQSLALGSLLSLVIFVCELISSRLGRLLLV